MLGATDGGEYARVVLLAVFQQRDAIAGHPVKVHNPRARAYSVDATSIYNLSAEFSGDANRSDLPQPFHDRSAIHA